MHTSLHTQMHIHNITAITMPIYNHAETHLVNTEEAATTRKVVLPQRYSRPPRLASTRLRHPVSPKHHRRRHRKQSNPPLRPRPRFPADPRRQHDLPGPSQLQRRHEHPSRSTVQPAICQRLSRHGFQVGSVSAVKTKLVVQLRQRYLTCRRRPFHRQLNLLQNSYSQRWY